MPDCPQLPCFLLPCGPNRPRRVRRPTHVVPTASCRSSWRSPCSWENMDSTVIATSPAGRSAKDIGAQPRPRAQARHHLLPAVAGGVPGRSAAGPSYRFRRPPRWFSRAAIVVFMMGLDRLPRLVRFAHPVRDRPDGGRAWAGDGWRRLAPPDPGAQRRQARAGRGDDSGVTVPALDRTADSGRRSAASINHLLLLALDLSHQYSRWGSPASSPGNDLHSRTCGAEHPDPFDARARVLAGVGIGRPRFSAGSVLGLQFPVRTQCHGSRLIARGRRSRPFAYVLHGPAKPPAPVLDLSLLKIPSLRARRGGRLQSTAAGIGAMGRSLLPLPCLQIGFRPVGIRGRPDHGSRNVVRPPWA